MALLVSRAARFAAIATIFSAACSGSINCGGCAGGLAPIPGGFDPAARIDRSVELRVTESGLGFIGTEFANLVGAYATMACGPTEPVPCPTNFRIGGVTRATLCDQTSETCVDTGTGDSEPVLGFEVERSVQSGATVCRDQPGSPGARQCFAWLRLEGLRMRPVMPNQLEATVTAQIYTTVIPIRYDPLGLDCIVTLDSNASGSGQQDFVVTAELREWTPPGGGEGRQLEVTIVNVDANIPNGDIAISRDPIHGDGGDTLGCGILNIGPIKNALVGRLVSTLASTIDEEVRSVIGWRCNVPNSEPCPAATTCNADNRCEDANGLVVPQRLGADGRIDFAGLLAGVGSPTAGQGDVGFLVGGTSGADATGVHIGVLGGMESAVADPRCAMPSQSPRLRPSYVAPRPFPAASTVDLDFDGTPERPFMMGAGISQQVLDQMLWTAYQSGLFCASVSSADTELINTGALSVLMPSIQQLTHADKYRWSIWPAGLTVSPGAEPRIVIGEGRTSGMPPNLRLESPLLELRLTDLQLSFSAVIEDRWVHLMKATADVAVPVGAHADANGDIYFVVGDLTDSVTNVRVSDHEILAETRMELEEAIPALLQVVLPQLTGQLLTPFSLPGAADLGGFELHLLGVRGVPDGAGGFGHVGLYLDLGFDPALAPNLSVAVESTAEILEVIVPSSEEMSVRHEGRPKLPIVELSLSAHAPLGAEVEHQLRIDGGPWSPFTRADRISLQRPEMLLQGRHQLEVRSRVAGDGRTLDPTPVVLPVVIDSEPPQLDVRVSSTEYGAFIRTFDVVSRDRVRVEIVVDGHAREASIDERNFAEIPELRDDSAIEIRATDEVGRSNSVVLRSARALSPVGPAPVASNNSGGCRCVSAKSEHSLALIALAFVVLIVRRRR